MARQTVHLLIDLRYSVRSFARAPAASLALVLTIALGVGSNAAVLGFVRGLSAGDRRLPDQDRLVLVVSRTERGAGAVSLDDFARLGGVAAFEAVGAVQETRRRLTVGKASSLVPVAAITPALRGLLQLPAGDDAIVSDRLRRGMLPRGRAGDDAIVRLDDEPVRVGAVAPGTLEGLFAGRAVDVWIPLIEGTADAAERRGRNLSVLARLRNGASLRQAQTELSALAEDGPPLAVLRFTGLAPEAAAGMARLGILLPAAAGLVFLIACANVAAFLLSRAAVRTRDTSVRIALGATRARLRRHLLADSLVVSSTGGIVGALFALWTSNILPAFLFEQDAGRMVQRPDTATVIAASLACMATTVACGMLPLLQLRHDLPANVLRRDESTPTRGLLRLRGSLVVVQMACCCTLVISAFLLQQGFRSALRTEAATALGEPMLATLSAAARYLRPDLGQRYFAQAEAEAMSVPGVAAAAWTSTPPGGTPAWLPARFEPPAQAPRRATIDLDAFTTDTLESIVVPPVAGRMFGGADTPDSCRVGVINTAAAERLFGGDAVGRVLQDPSGARVEIIGVVASQPPPDERPRPTLYYYPQQTGTALEPDRDTTVIVRSAPGRLTSGLLDTTVVSGNYFPAMGVSLTAGSLFGADADQPPCRVGVVDEEAAELYFGGRALGGAVIDRSGVRTEIVGVVRAPLLRASQRQGGPALFLPMAQDYLPRMTLLLGTRETSDRQLTELRRRLDAIPGALERPSVLTLEEQLTRTALADERIAAVLVTAASVIGGALGMLGLYGGMGDFVRQRRREFALRVALGAQRRRVIALVLGAGFRLAGAGTLAGLLGALGVARWLSEVTPGSPPSGMTIWIAGPLVLAVAVLVAGLLPARRAMLVDPLAIMREG